MPFVARDLSDRSRLIDRERLPQTTGSRCSPLNGHERSGAKRARRGARPKPGRARGRCP
jgi:hypothetical protein